MFQYEIIIQTVLKEETEHNCEIKPTWAAES